MSLKVCSLRNSDIKTRENAKVWTEALTPPRDNEDGQKFWKWMSDHQADSPSCCDTWFFLGEHDAVIGTASIVDDDQGVGKSSEINGVWLGGIVVDHKHRGRQYLKEILSFITRRMDELPQELKPEGINLFTNNIIPLRVYYEAGFKPYKTIEVENDSKKKEPQIVMRRELQEPLQPAEVLKYIGDLNTRALTYHNHKEQSAWLAMAFFAAVTVAAVTGGADKLWQAQSTTSAVALGLYMVVWITVLIVIYTQLSLRELFGNMTAACYSIEQKIISGELKSVYPWSFKPEISSNSKGQRTFPLLVMDEISKIRKTKHWKRIILSTGILILVTAIGLFGLSTSGTVNALLFGF